VTYVVIDDHLLRDVLAAEQWRRLSRLIATNELASTNLYYVRLRKSVVAARGGTLSGAGQQSGAGNLAGVFWNFPNQSKSCLCNWLGTTRDEQ
jgi:hypothetical protein